MINASMHAVKSHLFPETATTSPHESSITAIRTVKTPFDFDNVGFSKSTVIGGKCGRTVRFVCCAECEFGPLGVQDVSSGSDTPIYVDTSRLKLN